MLRFIISSASATTLAEAESYFPNSYRAPLQSKPTYSESMVARYLIAREALSSFGVKNYLPSVDSAGVPRQTCGLFWSLSHSSEGIFVGISDKGPVGVDVEYMKPRDKSIWSIFSHAEWEKLGRKTWENFYLLWTAKESFIKMHLGGLDDMENLRIDSIVRKNASFSGLSFSFKITFIGHPDVCTYSLTQNSFVYAVSIPYSHRNYEAD